MERDRKTRGDVPVGEPCPIGIVVGGDGGPLDRFRSSAANVDTSGFLSG